MKEKLFAAAIEAYPRSSKAHFAYGNAVRFAGRSAESIASYTEVSIACVPFSHVHDMYDGP